MIIPFVDDDTMCSKAAMQLNAICRLAEFMRNKNKQQ